MPFLPTFHQPAPTQFSVKSSFAHVAEKRKGGKRHIAVGTVAMIHPAWLNAGSKLHEDALAARLGRASNNTVLFLGEIGKRKGCYDIPAVVAEAVKVVPDVKFVLGGAGSPEDEAEV